MLSILKIRHYKLYKFVKKVYRYIFLSVNTANTINIKYYPIDINIEITTKCNAKCDSCTHDEIIASGDRPLKHMNIEFARNIIDKLKEMTVLHNIPQNLIKFSPVGLGEPLLNPDFFEIISYAKKIFPKAILHMNTNGILLTPEISKKLIECEIDYIYISLGYNNPTSYKKYMGVDKYDLVCKNIKTFLQLKGSKKPSVLIHNFDVPENRSGFHDLQKYWSSFINPNDSVVLYPYYLIKNFKQTKKACYPCNQLWSVIMIDVEGYIFPCCIGVWKKRDESILLGHIKDENKIIFEKLKTIQQNHLKKNFGTCESCDVLFSGEEINKKILNELGNLNLQSS